MSRLVCDDCGARFDTTERFLDHYCQRGPAMTDTASTEVATIDDDRGLALGVDQTNFTSEQQAALRQLGVDGASNGDLAIFFRACQRSGLDPFRKQIYMIGRPTKNQRTGRWETRWTIQTGIDGYRKITARTAAARGESVEYGPREWVGEDGQWREFWPKRLGTPEAARATITVGGRTYRAVAMYDEYVQTTKDGSPNSMWRAMPANQLAKCAEAAAHRMATPDDVAGILIEDEVQAIHVESTRIDRPGKGRDAARAALGIAPETEPEPEPEDASNAEPEPDNTQGTGPAETGDEPATEDAVNTLTTELAAANIEQAERKAYLEGITGRPLNGIAEMTAREVADAIAFTTTGELPIRD